jgi:hypothetical protein
MFRAKSETIIHSIELEDIAGDDEVFQAQMGHRLPRFYVYR